MFVITLMCVLVKWMIITITIGRRKGENKYVLNWIYTYFKTFYNFKCIFMICGFHTCIKWNPTSISYSLATPPVTPKIPSPNFMSSIYLLPFLITFKSKYCCSCVNRNEGIHCSIVMCYCLQPQRRKILPSQHLSISSSSLFIQ